MQAEPRRILLGELLSKMKTLVYQKLKLSASTCQAVFLLANQQGQGSSVGFWCVPGVWPGLTRSSERDGRAQGCSNTIPITQFGYMHQLGVSVVQTYSPKINQSAQISSLFEAH